MKRWKWKKVTAILCLIGCLVLDSCPCVTLVSAKMLTKTDVAGQQSTDSDEKQGLSDGGGTSGVIVDNQNIYEGMEKSYSGGYVPKIEGKNAVVVLPLLAKRKLLNDKMTVSVRFGEASNLPFVYKNYEKSVTYGYHKLYQSERTAGCYLVTFPLELKKERYNGSYPVVLSVNAEDEAGNEINQEFTVYVTITDGKQPDGKGQEGAADTGSTANIVIDNKHVYEGMEKSYSGGYVPKVGGGAATVVLPLLAKRKLSKNQMTVTLKFGEGENLPFVYKNYEKSVSYGYHKTGKGGKRSGCYLAAFSLKLKKDRYNGSYPVTLSVRAEDEAGNEINQDFTVYVTITDGKKPEGDAAATDGADDSLPQFAPKVMISSYEFSGDSVLCGEKSTAKLTLLNTSKTDGVKNMLVTVAPDENIELLDKTNSTYIEKLGTGKTCNLSFAFRVKKTVPSGQYNIGVTMDYADAKGNAYTVQGTVKVSAQQAVQIEIAPVAVPKEIQLGETIELQAQAMNLGKGMLYNVRAVVEADGLISSGSAFIGDIEAGTAMNGSLELTAEGLSGDSLYGKTQGKITFYYEDEMGNEMTQEQEFETSILSPLKEAKENDPADDTRQWWVIMAVIVVILISAAVLFFVRKANSVHENMQSE